MEVHADAVAASVSGSHSLGTALKRIELAASCYDITLQKCDEFYKQKKLSSNIYPQQKLVLQKIAEEYKLPLQNGLPQISDEFFNNSNNSRINYKDQWASHPSTGERIKYLDELAIPAEIMEESAWVIFSNKEQLQKQLTQKIYEAIELPEDAGTVDETEFENKLNMDTLQYSFPEVYNGFFDNRQITMLEVNELKDDETAMPATFEELFSAEHAALHKKINTSANDIEILKAIGDKRIDVKSFDFDGEKYSRAESASVIEKLETELTALKSLQEKLDRQAVQLFMNLSKKIAGTASLELTKSYESYFELRRKADEFLTQMNGMLDGLSPVFAGQSLQIEIIQSMISQLKRDHEPLFKQKLQYWISQQVFNDNPELLTRINSFISSDYAYFGDTSFFENELNELHSLCNESWTAVNNYIFKQFKSILEVQLQYVPQ